MNQKVNVVKKNGYNIWAEVNPKTKKLFNYCITGVGVNPKATYTYVYDAEKIIDRILTRKN